MDILKYIWALFKPLGWGFAPFVGSIVVELLWTGFLNDYWVMAKIQFVALLLINICVWAQVFRQGDPVLMPWRKWGNIWIGIALFQMFFSGFQGAIQAPSKVSINCPGLSWPKNELRDGVAVVHTTTVGFSFNDDWLNDKNMKCLDIQDVYKYRFGVTILYCLCNFGALWLTLVNVPIPVLDLLQTNWSFRGICGGVVAWVILNISLDDILWTGPYTAFGFLAYMYLVYKHWLKIQFTAGDRWKLMSFFIVTLNFAFVVCLESWRFNDIRKVASYKLSTESSYGRFMLYVFSSVLPREFKVSQRVGHFDQLRYYSWFSWLYSLQHHGVDTWHYLPPFFFACFRFLFWAFVYNKIQGKIQEHEDAVKQAANAQKAQVQQQRLDWKDLVKLIESIYNDWHHRKMNGAQLPGYYDWLRNSKEACERRYGQGHPNPNCNHHQECYEYVQNHTLVMMELAFMEDLIAEGRGRAATQTQRTQMDNWSNKLQVLRNFMVGLRP